MKFHEICSTYESALVSICQIDVKVIRRWFFIYLSIHSLIDIILERQKAIFLHLNWSKTTLIHRMKFSLETLLHQKKRFRKFAI